MILGGLKSGPELDQFFNLHGYVKKDQVASHRTREFFSRTAVEPGAEKAEAITVTILLLIRRSADEE